MSYDNLIEFGETLSEIDVNNSHGLSHSQSAGHDEPGSFENYVNDSRFRKMPQLSRAFIKRKVGGRSQFVCIGCVATCKTNEILRLVKHVKKCRKLNEVDRREIEEAFNEMVQKDDFQNDSNRSRNIDWVDVMVENNFSINSIESKSFRAFMKKNVPLWRLASRHQISDLYIPRMSAKLQQEFLKTIRAKNDLLSIEFDHWKDSNQRSLLGVVITTRNGSKHLQDLVDVSLVGHANNVIVEQLKTSLASIPKRLINAFVSDSASACTLAREKLVSEHDFKFSLHHRCMAHLLNRLGNKITSQVQDVIEWASTITAYVNAHPIMVARFKQQGIAKVQRHCSVRWFSTVNMIESLIEAKNVILEELHRCRNEERIMSFFDESRWESLADSLFVLRPLANYSVPRNVRNSKPHLSSRTSNLYRGRFVHE